MAFCNSCGAALDAGTRFCNKCGALQTASTPAPAATPAPPSAVTAPPAPAPTGGSGALKIILIVIAVIVGIGILGVASLGFFAYRVAKSAHVTQNGDSVKVDTPFGSFSANDPDQTVKELGVDVYPGATVQKQGTATATFGGVHTVVAYLVSGAPLDKVCEFYIRKVPGAAGASSEEKHCSIVSGRA